MTAAGRRRAIFLDRDGVLNIDTGYPHRPEELRLTASAGEAVRLLNEARVLAIVVTNQSGVARGLFDVADIHLFHAAMQAALAEAGAQVDAFYYCPYHPDGDVAAFAREHPDRKPAPGMILRAMADWSVDPVHAALIGDKPSDMAAAAAAGVRGIPVPRDLPDLADVVRRAIA